MVEHGDERAWASMIRLVAVVFCGVLSAVSPNAASGQARSFSLATTDGLRFHNTTAEAVTFKDKRGVRVVVAPEVARRPEYVAGQVEFETFAQIADVEFSNGVIEAEVAGTPAEGASAGARGFVGIAFRLQATSTSDGPQTYDAFYLRPTNGRAEDQERRNHSVQYISHPAWTWSRLRRETPSRYESYVDIQPDTWTKIRIEVRGAQARLFVHDQPQPVLIVNDVKSGPSAKGAIALWIGPGTVAHFRNVVVTP
jgi:hypothetical protein